VADREVVGGELGGDRAPAEGEACADHGHDRVRAAERAHQIGDQAGGSEAHQHQRDRELLRVHGAARRRRQAGADDAGDDHAHRDVLVATGRLAEDALAEQHQHQEARGQSGLHHDQRRQHQRQHLQGEAEDRQAGAGQPAHAPQESPHERQPQVLVIGRLTGVESLEGDP